MPSPPRNCGPVASQNPRDAFCSLSSHLVALRASGHRFRMWWRDDDGCRDTAEMRRLLAARQDTPIALALIPGLLDSTLVNLVDGAAGVSVLQHGWKHINWSRDDSRPSEFPETRSRSEACDELRKGFQILEASFGGRFKPVFVPPWHSCSRWLMDARSQLGYRAVSSEAPLFPLLSRGWGEEVNVEIDTANWTAGGAFIGPLELTRKIIRAFEIRLSWSAEAVPIGLLSHHGFLTRSDCGCLSLFVRLLEESDVVEWVGVESLT